MANAFREAMIRTLGPEAAAAWLKELARPPRPRPACFLPEELEERLPDGALTERRIARLVKELTADNLERMVPRMVPGLVSKEFEQLTDELAKRV